jgi:hypothetical protein
MLPKVAGFVAPQGLFVDPTRTGAKIPSVRVTLPDGTVVTSDSADSAISPTDPVAQYTAAANGPAVYVYSDNYLIDARVSPSST